MDLKIFAFINPMLPTPDIEESERVDSVFFIVRIFYYQYKTT